MKQYKTYKDSGVEWIGEIPKQWEVSKVKFLFDIQKGKTPKKLLDELSESDLEIYLSMDYLRGNPKQIFYVGNDENIIISEEGDILLLWDGSNAGEFMLSKKGVLSSTMAKITNKSINKSYQWFLFKCFERILKDSCNGMGIPHVDGKLFRGSILPLPSTEEQTQIANYLNNKTEQLDTLIAKKEQLISLLQEERTAMINQAVTKGLDPNVPMKDSGIDWLGEIPAHWGLKKLRYLGNNQNGISEGAEFFGKGFPFVSYSDVFKNRVLPVNASGLANSNEKHWSNYSVEKGDVFFTRTSETIEEIGMSSVCKKTIDKATFAGFLIRFRPYKGKLDIDFSKYYFSCFIPRVFFVKEMNLVTRASLSQELLKRLPVLVPSIEEQFKIAQYLNVQTEKIDKTLDNISKQIKQLKEYKTALISEVVTGKVDVREEVLN
jgi:type I restriction enzyme S subunit